MCTVLNVLNDTRFLSLRSYTLAALFVALGSPALLCVLGNRMFFNLRQAAEHAAGLDSDQSWSTFEHDALEFGLGGDPESL